MCDFNELIHSVSCGGSLSAISASIQHISLYYFLKRNYHKKNLSQRVFAYIIWSVERPAAIVPIIMVTNSLPRHTHHQHKLHEKLVGAKVHRHITCDLRSSVRAPMSRSRSICSLQTTCDVDKEHRGSRNDRRSLSQEILTAGG